MISVDNLSKSYGAQVLFDEASFKINAKERVGLIGRNGHGKTTLLRMLVGEEEPDGGAVNIPRHYRLGYVRQHLDFTEPTLLLEGARGLRPEDKDQLWKVEKILAGLGFSAADMQRNPAEFSGGYQVRLNLSKVLVSEPDLLLLDEPTNYLDITSIRWIERFLLSWPHELLLITHDRAFMDRIVTHTLGIYRQKVRKIEGNTEKYYTQIAQEEEIYEKTRLNDEKRRKEMEQFVTRFRAKARLAGLVQSRVKALEKMEKKDRLTMLKNMDFSFRETPFPGKHMLNTNDLRFGYNPGQPLIHGLNLTVAPGDRICVVGKNGRGKTTLLKLLAGSLRPDSGTVSMHSNARPGYFEQTNIQHLVDSRTIEEEIRLSSPDVEPQMARGICGAMLFEGDAALKKISVLSGGEKSRVMLGKLLVTPLNLLLLDEPTNHLDMESCDALLEAIDCFEGAVVMVTHNEMFLHAVAERLVVFDEQESYVFEGSYQDFLEKGGWHDEEERAAARPDDEKPTRKDIKRARSQIINERSRLLRPLEERIATAENGIDECEQALSKHNDAMQEAAEAQDGERITTLSREIHDCETRIEALFDELEQLTTEHEQHTREFDARLAELEG